MPNQFYMQNNFTHGELDPRMFAGTNLDYYYKSLKRARNVYVRPQGGVKKRHGTVYEKTITTNSGEYRMAEFIYNKDLKFLVLFLVGKLIIYLVNSDGSLGVDQEIVDADFTAARLPDIQFAQNANNMIIVHPDFQPKALTYDLGTSLFVDPIANLNIKNPPAYDFEKNYYTYTFTINNEKTGTGRTLNSSTAVFEANHVGGLFIAVGSSLTEPIGLARIRTVTGPYPATAATVDVIYPFDTSLSSGGALGDACFLGESALSATRGWPKTITFYENRLVFGGTEQLPQTLFLSKIGSFEDFDQGDSSDDDAIISTLSTEAFNEIKFLVSDKTLQVYCTESLFSSMQTFDEPLTPSDSSFRKQASYGVNDLKPILLDNKTFVCRRGGKAILEMVFDPGSNYYMPEVTSLFSSILVDNPIHGTALIGDSVDDGDYMFLVNQDGSLLVYQSLSSQNISAFTVCATGPDHVDPEIINPQKGKFKDIVHVDNYIYAIIERVLDGNSPPVTITTLERLSFDYYTDSSVDYSTPHPTNIVKGLSHLEGEKVVVTGSGGRVLRVDNEVDGGVVKNGQVTLLDQDADTDFKAGLNFNVLVETIPANLAGQGKLYIPKKIVRLFIDYYESLGIKVNGEYIPELIFGNNVLDTPPVPSTGVFETRGTEWGDRVTIKITQDDPLPLLIIGLGFEVTA